MCSPLWGGLWRTAGRWPSKRKGSKVVRSVLFEYTRLNQGTVFDEVVASSQYCVDRHGKTTYQGDESTSLRWGDARA